MRSLAIYLKNYRKESILAPFFKFLEVVFDLLVPVVIAQIIDVGITGNNRPYIIQRFFILVLMAAAGLTVSITAQYFAAKASVGFATELRQAVYDHVQKLSYTELDTLGTDTLITRLTDDINQVQNGVNMGLRLLLRSPFIVLGSMIMAFTINTRCALVFAVAIPFLFLVVFVIMYLSIPLFRKVQSHLDIVTRLTRENLTGVRVIRAFCREKESVQEFDQSNEQLTRLNEFVGRIGIGRVHNGEIHTGEMVNCVRLDGTTKAFRIQKLFGYYGYSRVEIDHAEAGDIVAIAGLADISVGETICEQGKVLPLPVLHIDEPTLQMTFGANTSPFVGRDGKLVTARKIEERLLKETQKDVSLKVETATNDSFLVSGRGELHLGILIENMRREGFELQVSKPKVIIKEIDGVKYEPWEDLQIEIPEDCVGSIIEQLGLRGANLQNMENFENQVRLNYKIPSRGLIGFMTDFMTMTKGYGIINHTFSSYEPYESVDIGERKLGVLVSVDSGQATAYSIGNLEDRGIMFIEPGCEVYEGMIIGECNRDNDLAVNVTKGKQLTNTRAAGSDHTVVLKRPRPITLEYALDYINSDELIEVTPNNIRLRKKILNTEERKKFDAKKKK